MLYNEFLQGVGREESEGMLYAYNVINKLYMEDQLNSKLEAFGYYIKNRNDFDWIDELDIGHGQRAEKSVMLNEIISEEKAKGIINKWFCFEIDKIEICGTPYYVATDFNHIVFMVKGYSRVFSNGILHDIYR